MNDVIIAALISSAATLIVCLVTNASQNSKTRALIEYKLNELTKRVDKHNNVIERTYHLEEDVSVIKEKIKIANHRIENVEEKVSKHE